MTDCIIGLNKAINKTLKDAPWFQYREKSRYIEVLDSPKEKINRYNAPSVAIDLAEALNKKINESYPGIQTMFYAQKHTDKVVVHVKPTSAQINRMETKDHEDLIDIEKQIDEQLQQEEFKKLAEESNLFLNEYQDVVPTEEDMFNDNLFQEKDDVDADNNSGKQDTQGFKEFVENKQYSKLTTEEKARTIEEVTKKHRSITALKDLSAKLAWRIGGNVSFKNKTDVDWKGSNQGMNSVLNEAYMTLDTPFHEIMAHPIIRAIKNKNFNIPSYTYVENTRNTLIKDSKDIFTVRGAKNSEEFGTKSFNTKEEAQKYAYKLNKVSKIHTTLYQNLLKELETGKGKEVLDRVKRDYVYKSDKIVEQNIKQLNNWKANLEKNPNDKIAQEWVKNLEERIQKEKYTLEEQQEEAIVELLGLYAADKIDKVKDKKLWEYLRDLWNSISDFVKQLLKQDGIVIDKLPITTTLNDLANIMAYGNNKIILPGYKVEYQTPLGNKYDTLQEVNNEIKSLADSNVEVDLSGVEIKETSLKGETNPINKKIIKSAKYIKESDAEFLHDENQWEPPTPALFEITHEDNTIESYYDEDLWHNNKEALELFGKIIPKKNDLSNFIEKNKEYEQSKEIIEQWKKENNIQYDPQEVYSRGQGFYSSIGAYSNLELDLLFQNLLQHIGDNKKANGEFTISAFTKPIDSRLKHIEGIEGKVRFNIFPQSNDIKWAAPTDVYSGSVWDAHKKTSKDKKSEILGVSYTKAPSLQNVNKISPNLADIIDNLSHAHNELGIELTPTNFRIEYDSDLPYESKKLIDNINKILDDKYGKIKVPVIEKGQIEKYKVKSQEYFEGEVIETEQSFNTLKEAEDFIEKRKVFNSEKNTTLEIVKGKQPTQTKDNVSSIESVKSNILATANRPKLLEDLKEGDGFMYFENNGKYYKEDLSKQKDIEITKEEYEGKKEYTSQALTNLKIATLKEVARKYPRSLITSKVVPINENLVNNNNEIQYSKRGKQNIQGLKEFVGEPQKDSKGQTKLFQKEAFNQNTANDVLNQFGHTNSEIKDYSLSEVFDFIADNKIKGVYPVVNQNENVQLNDLNNDKIEFQEENVEIKKQAQVFRKVTEILDSFKNRFNITYTIDFDLNQVAVFDTETRNIRYNPNKVKLDTPYHEIAHPLILVIKESNRALYDALIKEAVSNTQIYNRKAELYPELSQEALNEEVLAEVIGLTSKNKIESKKAKSLVEKFFIYISNLLSKLLGKTISINNLTTINQVAEMLANSNQKLDLNIEYNSETRFLEQATDDEVTQLEEAIEAHSIKEETINSHFKKIELDLKNKQSIVNTEIDKVIKSKSNLPLSSKKEYLSKRKESLAETLSLISANSKVASIAHYIESSFKRAKEMQRAYSDKIVSKMADFDSLSKEDQAQISSDIAMYSDVSQSFQTLKELRTDPFLYSIFSSVGLVNLDLNRKINEALYIANDITENTLVQSKVILLKVITNEIDYANLDMGKIEAELGPRIRDISKKIEYKRKQLASATSESNRKKIENTISKLITQQTEAVEEFERLDLNPDAIMKALSFSSKDISKVDAFLTPAILNPDIIVSSFIKFLKRNFSNLRNKLMAFENEVGHQYAALSAKSGKSIRSDVEFQDFIETIDEPIFEETEDGAWSIKGSKKYKTLIAKYDYQKFNEGKNQMFKKANAIKDKKQKGAFINDWFSKNTDKISDSEINNKKDFQKSLLRDKLITQEEYDTWLIKNQYKDNLTGRTYYRGEFAMPKESLYLSKKYQNLLLPQNAHKKTFYDWYVNKYLEFQEKLPPSHRRGLKLPSIDKGSMGRYREDSMLSSMKDLGRDILKYKAEDQAYGETSKFGVEEKRIPVYFTQDMTADEQSSDLIASLLLFGQKASEYEMKTEIHPQVKMMISTALKREYGKTSSKGIKVFDSFINKMFNKKEQVKKDDTTHKNSTNQLLDAINNIFYGETKKKEEWRGIAIDKLVDSITGYQSKILLGGIRIKALANNLQANAMNLTESAAKEFIGHKGHAAGKSFYWKNSGSLIGDMANRKLYDKGLASLLIEHFDAVPGLFEEQLAKSKSGNAAKKGNDNNLAFFMQNLSEHEAQIGMFFGHLFNQKIDSNGKVWSKEDYVLNELKKRNIETSKYKYALNAGNESVVAKMEKEYDSIVAKIESEFDSIKLNLLHNGFQKNKTTGALELQNGVQFDENQKFQIESRVHGLGLRMYGVYDSLNSVEAQRYAIGRAALHLRKHAPQGVKRRWKSLGWDSSINGFTEGFYLTFIKNMGDAIADRSTNALLNFASMTPMEKANMRRFYMEAGLIMISSVMAMIISGITDDDEYKNEDGVGVRGAFLVDYLANRLESELKQYYDPMDFLRIAATPAVSISFAEKFFQTMKMVWGVQFSLNDEERVKWKLLSTYNRKQGMWEKGDSKFLAKFYSLFGITGNEWNPRYATQNLKRFTQ